MMNQFGDYGKQSDLVATKWTSRPLHKNSMELDLHESS